MIPLTTIAQNTNGVILYHGPSRLSPDRNVVVILTGLKAKSTNAKTGAILQTYILDADTPPSEAVKNHDDVSVCGDCVHSKLRTCYVNVAQAPSQVFAAFKRGSYQTVSPEALDLSGKTVRIGSYGDPTAVPLDVWTGILKTADSHTGYTHQWKKRHASRYKSFLMASVDTAEQAVLAKKKGWRYFRVKSSGQDKLPNEIVCPASAEQNHRLTCRDCQACDGSRNSARKDIVIDAHGIPYKIARWKQHQLQLAA
jgi:hypothetical protein